MAAVHFEPQVYDSRSRARAGLLQTPHGSVQTPFFCVVGTAATVKALTPAHLTDSGVAVVLANTYHLYLRPGHRVVAALGGLHKLMRWNGPIVTDSGGFQVFSLGAGMEHGVGKQISMFPGESPPGDASLRTSNARLMNVDDDGVSFASHIDGSLHRLTPELSMEVQEALGADIALAFDEPTSPLHDLAYTIRAMQRTHAWARRCLDVRARADQALYGIVQGGAFAGPRVESARYVASLPFDGVAIGGSLGKSKADMRAVLEWSTPSLPEHWPRHMLGIGEPEDLFDCVAAGVDQFDCVTPTRLARHGRLYTQRGKVNALAAEWELDPSPIEETCTCYTCQGGFGRGYIRHLFRSKELLAYTLASIHNVHFLMQLMAQIRGAIGAGAFEELRSSFLGGYLHPVTA